MNNKNTSVHHTRWISWIGSIVSAIIAVSLAFIDFFQPARIITTIISVSVLGAIISILIDNHFKKRREKYNQEEEEKRKNLHFPESYPIINKDIPHVLIENTKSQSEQEIDRHKEIDKTIKSPLEYTYETLRGNQAPVFEPNKKYLDDIYENVLYIVAITAENPNLWLDPTLCFYMTNCCAVSLMYQANKHIGKKIEIKDFGNNYSDFVQNESNSILEKLKNKEDLDKEFVRFLIFTEKQKECLQDTVFPSLKASQDLFRIKSFFIQKDNIKNKLAKKDYLSYKKCVEIIWEEINKENPTSSPQFAKILNNRKNGVIPEFLILFKGNEEIMVHTYINGSPYYAKLNSENKDIVKELIAYLAKYRLKNRRCDWIPSGEKLNTTKSYIEWS